jgi:hypothetical protein
MTGAALDQSIAFVPRNLSSGSRVFWPMFCTREWQGM